ncbi:unnamed protein product [Phytophthora fragariaefolia]|uniref:Unnamed protein product n=1 Tax=Phytophthora fragariaefolia TaxID=1490495 RepID=A0A9W6Y0P9_9STRA|nr:unnamed protein product [Phytophthora fragariaefolia]
MAASVPTEHHFPAQEVTRRATAPDTESDQLNSINVTPFVAKGSALMDLFDGEAQAFRHLAHSIVSRTLAHQIAYQGMNYPELGQGDWKLLKRRNDLGVYKRRPSRGVMESNRRMVLCVGSIPGTLEDVLYGVHSKTREEMQLVAPHLSKGYVDCKMLAKLEGGSPIDPYRQLSLNWHLTVRCQSPIVSVRFSQRLSGMRSSGTSATYACSSPWELARMHWENGTPTTSSRMPTSRGAHRLPRRPALFGPTSCSAAFTARHRARPS